jgi:hypothetical protein
MTFGPLSQTRLFQNSRGLGVGGEKVLQKHVSECEDAITGEEGGYG